MICTCIDFVYHLFTRKHCLPFSAMPCDEIKGMTQRQKSARTQILLEHYKSDKTCPPLLHSDYRQLTTSCFLYQLYHDFVQNSCLFTSLILTLVITFMVFEYQQSFTRLFEPMQDTLIDEKSTLVIQKAPYPEMEYSFLV